MDLGGQQRAERTGLAYRGRGRDATGWFFSSGWYEVPSPAASGTGRRCWRIRDGAGRADGFRASAHDLSLFAAAQVVQRTGFAVRPWLLATSVQRSFVLAISGGVRVSDDGRTTSEHFRRQFHRNTDPLPVWNSLAGGG